MVRNKDNEAMIDALEAFETALATPVPPGELEPWSQSLWSSTKELDEPLRRQIDEVHRRDMDEIEEQDLELSPRLARLRQHDAENLKTFKQLRTRIRELAEAASRIEPDEKLVQDERVALVDEGLQFVIAVRRQEVALQTWLMESFDRERGTGD